MTNITMSLRNKYFQTSGLLAGFTGKLLDFGARDCALAKYLPKEGIGYVSADASPGCDLQLNLEERLPLEDGAFDAVVALDVLEHIERIHDAFAELARVSSKHLVIGLPCMGTLPRRLAFLFAASLMTDKYALTGNHPGDRHRWLTLYHDIISFYEAMAEKHGLKLAALQAQFVPSYVLLPTYPLAVAGVGRALVTERLIGHFIKP